MRLAGIAVLLVVLAAIACTSDEATPTASPTGQVASPTASATVAPTSVVPTATPWVAPPPVTNRPGEPRIAPGPFHPSVGLREDGIPVAASGTLVVYGKEIRGTSFLELVVFDLERQERLSSFELRANRGFSVQLAGTRVVASFGREVWSYALDGSDARLLHEDRAVSYMQPSPDGALLGLTGTGPAGPYVALVEVATGNRLWLVDLLEAESEWLGEPHPARWLSSTELLIGSLCHCDGSPEGFFDVIVSIDGEVGRNDGAERERDVHVEITDGFDVSCVLVGHAGGRTVRLVDATSGATLAEARAETPVFTGWELSPHGDEALVISLVVEDELAELLNTTLAEGGCVERGSNPLLDEAPFALGVLKVGADRVESVQSRLEVFERWYPERLPVFVCGGERLAGAETSDWVLSPALWRSPVGFGAPWGFTADGCRESGSALLDMWIGDVEVDTGARQYRVLGFFDADPAAAD